MLLNEFFRKKLNEGGNLAIGQHQADQINLQVTNRSVIVPILNNLLLAINNGFAKQYGTPLWNPAVLKSQKFLSGSSLHFFNVKGISDQEFIAKKPKVGDIDTMVAKEAEPNLEEFLNANQGKAFGPATLIGFQRGNEQFSSLWELQDPPIKVQVDLEFVAHQKGSPTDWARFSHSSSWDDIKEGVKGVFHKFLIQSFAVLSQQDFLLRKMTGRGKARVEQDIPTTDNMVSFAVSSKEGGGLRAKYEPVLDDSGNPIVIDGLPVMRALPAEGYKQDIGDIFAALFGDRITPDQIKSMDKQFWSFTGLLQVMNSLLGPEEKQAIVDSFIEKLFAKGAQGLYKNDPERDMAEKNAALNVMFNTLQVQRPAGLDQLQQSYKANYRVTSESVLREADEQPAVKAQLRKGMPHLRDLKAVDFLDLLDEIHDGNGRFKLENIPLNVKVDGFGGRFGKNAAGQPFMGTSRTEPRYAPGFVAHHQKKGTTDPDILARAQLFDDLFNEMMNAVSLVDSVLGPDFLVDKQVTCEVLFLPFATETPEGKLKFVGIHYDKLPEGVQLALVPFHVVQASTGEPVEGDKEFIDQLLKVGQQGSVMFINNRLTQKEGLDVTEIINVLDNIEELKQIVGDTQGKRDRASLQLKKEVEEKLLPIKEKLEDAIINDPNIIGKDMLGQDYEGIVINSRLGPIKVTSSTQRKVIADKQAAKKAVHASQAAAGELPQTGNKTAVVAIGSFVGHKGHQQLFDYTISKANQVNGDPYLFMGNAVGKDDPIPVPVKIETWRKMYPQYAKHISATQEGGTLMQKIKHELIQPMPGRAPRYDNIIIMVGEDQAGMNIAQALMKAVNKFQGYEHVKVTLEATPRGTGMSFTKLRNVLKDPNATEQQQFAMWNDAFNGGDFGAQKLSPEWIKHLMDVTKQGMGIQQKFTPPPKSAAEVPVPTQAQTPMKTMESIQREMMMLRAEITWHKELLESGQNASQMAPPSGPAWDKTGGHHRLSEEDMLDRATRQKIIQFIHKAKGWGISDLELAKDNELIYMYKKIKAGEDIQETKRMSTAVKLQRAWERQQAKSAASRERGNNILNPKKGSETPKPVGAGSGEVKMSEEESKALSQTAKRLTDPKDGAVAKLRAAGDKRREDQLKSRDIAKKNETMLPKSAFAGSDKNKLGRAGQLMGKDKRPAKAGDLVGGAEESYDKKKGSDGKACWKGYRYAGTSKGKDRCVPIGESWESEMARAISLLEGKNNAS